MNLYYLHRDLLLKTRVSSIMEMPVPTKAIVHASTKATLSNKTNILPLVTALSLVSGQQPVLTRAKCSIASFRLRQSHLLGCKVTLRHHRWTELLTTLVYAVLPQSRDFVRPQVQGTQVSFGVPTLVTFPQIEDHYEIFEHAGGCAFTLATSHSASLVLSWYGIPCQENK